MSDAWDWRGFYCAWETRNSAYDNTVVMEMSMHAGVTAGRRMPASPAYILLQRDTL